MVVNHLRVHWEYLKVALSTAMEYKINFIIQVLAMVFNDVVWIIFWLIFFNRFQNVGGWVLGDMLMLYAIITLSYGLSSVFFGNRNRIAEIVNQGKLDFYLALPKNVLFHVLISRSSFYGLGDVVFGIILAFIVLSLASLSLFLILVLASTSILLSVAILSGSLAFFFGKAEATSRNIFMGTLSLASYPLSVYQGVTKFILLTIIPAGFISGVPVELLKSFNAQWFWLTIGFVVLIFSIATFVFYRGLKKYESGNLMYVRT
ncbi:hypothetical protein HN662_04890 [Candidatus Woesearchaeota archaeon]|nr:hypothetical protein [Candidatus Woesearchaeota archaeon]